MATQGAGRLRTVALTVLLLTLSACISNGSAGDSESPEPAATAVTEAAPTGNGSASDTASATATAAVTTDAATSAAGEVDRVVDLGGGRTLYLRCTGTGSPTLVLEGGDEDTSQYAFAEAALAAETRTCVYDRANLGRSGPAPGPRGLRELVDDLEALLDAADVPEPYVLVGTSGGGTITAGYAQRHPDQIAGMVFVETPAPFFDAPPEVVEETAWDHPGNVEQRDYLQVDFDAWAGLTLIGDIPVTIISNDYGPDAEEEGERRNVVDQQGWFLLSPCAQQVVVTTGHAVEEADPQLVIETILDVVQAAQAAPTATPTASAPGVDATALAGRVVFARAGGPWADETIFVADLDGGNEVQLTEPDVSCCPAVSRDGRQVLFPRPIADGRIGVSTVGIDGAGTATVPTADPTLNLGAGSWSPDGRTIAVEAWDDTDASRSGVYLLQVPDGSGLTRLTSPEGVHDIPQDFSPDGSQLLFFRETANSTGGSLWVIDVAGGEPRLLTPRGVDFGATARWSPDGARIALTSPRGAPERPLWLVDPDGTDLARVFSDPEGRFVTTPAWSPDGTQLLFALSPDSDDFEHPHNGLYVIGRDGTGLSLAIGGDDFKREPTWIP